jgi:hypothetical protein
MRTPRQEQTPTQAITSLLTRPRTKKPVSDEALAILKANRGSSDAFGRAYGKLAGTAGAEALGDSRPFQTEQSVMPLVGPHYFNMPADNVVYNRGPVMNLNVVPAQGRRTRSFA